MASGSGWNLLVWLAGSGCGWNLWVWLVGMVVRKYIHITYPYSSCICSFLQQHPYFLFIFKMLFVFVLVLTPYTGLYWCAVITNIL